MRDVFKPARGYKRVLMAAAMMLTATIGTATTAQARGPIVYKQSGGSVPMYYAPCNCTNVQQWLPQSSRFDMWCWTDHQWFNGNYGSSRWFRGQTHHGGAVGFVHSSYVYYQTSVPRC